MIWMILALAIWNVILTLMVLSTKAEDPYRGGRPLYEHFEHLERHVNQRFKEVSAVVWPEMLSVEPYMPMMLGGIRGYRVVKRQKWEPTLQSPVMSTEEEAKFLLNHPNMIRWEELREERDGGARY